MERFHIIEDGAVILRLKGGLFRQVKVYRRGPDLFAGHGGGFLKLGQRGSTSNPHVSWVDLEADGVRVDRSGDGLRWSLALPLAAE